MGLKKVRQARGPEDSVWYDDDGLMKMKIKVSAKTEGRLTALAIAAGNISLKLSRISAIAFILLNNKAASCKSRCILDKLRLGTFQVL